MALKTRRRFGPQPAYPKAQAYREEYGFFALAGPCSIEDQEQAIRCACAAADAGATHFRGGVFSAGTYPKDQFGLRHEHLKAMKIAARKEGLKAVVEAIDLRDLDTIDLYADALQVGDRQAQGYALLKEVSRSRKEVFLKAGRGMTWEEILGALEYLARGACKPRLIVRGSVSFHDHVRWDLSISLIAKLKQETGIPVLVDPSHGTGERSLVRPMALAGIAAGADGLLVEMHPDPCNSVSDAEQAVSLDEGKAIVMSAREVWASSKAWRGG